MDKASLAADLLSTQAIKLNPEDPFLYASGMRGPIYCDNRLIISYPLIRRRFTRAMHELSQKITFQVIAATATAGIPHGAWLAESFNVPMVYVRGSSKTHGNCKQVEGAFKPNQRVLLVEDLVTTGKSSLMAVEALRAEGLEVHYVISLFQYGLPGVDKRFEAADVYLKSVLTLDELLNEAHKMGRLDSNQIMAVKKWQHNPIQWNESLVKIK
tara:strand:+ start:517 stop:1155 length:639 start_codon:yes stop_codon:yes gene_type:complete